jgi:hypothetical protein
MNYQNIHVNGNRMEPNRIYAGTRGSYITDVSFSFSGEWEGLTKKLIFYPVRGTPVYTVYTYGTVRIPARVMRNAGISVMLISGYRVTEDGKIGEKIITASASVLVESAESDTRNEPDIPEATVFEEIVAKLGAPYIGESGNWYIWDVDTHEFVDTGLPARGEKGETGRGLTILGKYGSLDELRESVKDAQPGDAYAVGEKAPYTIYIWDEVTGDFTNHGDMRGVGITKIEQITDNIGSGEPNTIRIVTDDGAEYDYTVYNGERGHPGNIWIGETEPPDDSYTIWLNPGGAVSGFLESHQGTENAGRVLVVGEDGKVTTEEQMQADWDQHDSTASDYVKNRPIWQERRVVCDILAETPAVGEIVQIYSGNVSSITKFLIDPNSSNPPDCYRMIFEVDLTANGQTLHTTSPLNLYAQIGGNNCLLQLTQFHVYVISDVSTLTEEYASKFSSAGIYIEYWKSSPVLKYNNIEIYWALHHQLVEQYIPTTIARASDVIPLPATASVGQTIKVSAVDANGKPTAWVATNFPEGGGGSGGWIRLSHWEKEDNIVIQPDAFDVSTGVYTVSSGHGLAENITVAPYLNGGSPTGYYTKVPVQIFKSAYLSLIVLSDTTFKLQSNGEDITYTTTQTIDASKFRFESASGNDVYSNIAEIKGLDDYDEILIVTSGQSSGGEIQPFIMPTAGLHHDLSLNDSWRPILYTTVNGNEYGGKMDCLAKSDIIYAMSMYINNVAGYSMHRGYSISFNGSEKGSRKTVEHINIFRKVTAAKIRYINSLANGTVFDVYAR